MSDAVLQLRDINKSFGLVHVIRGVNLDIGHNERHAVIGPNGAGKSTLFNLISGQSSVSHGRIMLNGKDISNQPPYQVRRAGLSRSFQVTNIFPRLTVYQTLQCAVLWSLGHRYNFWRPIRRLPDVREEATDSWK